MPDKPEERLIILLPPALLAEVRRPAEEADLSVSQIVRRAIRNELKTIAAGKNNLSAEELQAFLKRTQIPLSSLLNSGLREALQSAWLHGVDGVEPHVKLSDLARSQSDSVPP